MADGSNSKAAFLGARVAGAGRACDWGRVRDFGNGARPVVEGGAVELGHISAGTWGARGVGAGFVVGGDSMGTAAACF